MLVRPCSPRVLILSGHTVEPRRRSCFSGSGVFSLQLPLKPRHFKLIPECGEHVDRLLTIRRVLPVLEADEPIAQHLLVWIQEMVTLQEEHLGTYEAPAWAVGRGTRLVAIRPVARLVVGAQGRVDVSYGPRHAMLLRTGPEVWKVRMPGANTTLVADLTPDTFADVLQSMLA